MNIREIKRNLSWYRDELYNYLSDVVLRHKERLQLENRGVSD